MRSSLRFAASLRSKGGRLPVISPNRQGRVLSLARMHCGLGAAYKIHCMEGKYSIELFRIGGEGAGLEQVLARDDNLAMAPAIYKSNVSYRPGRLIMLCDRARVLARSDRPETMPQ